MTDDYLARIGNLIRDARKHRGWTQQQLADVLTTSQSAVNRIERGHQNLSLEMLARIGEAARLRDRLARRRPDPPARHRPHDALGLDRRQVLQERRCRAALRVPAQPRAYDAATGGPHRGGQPAARGAGQHGRADPVAQRRERPRDRPAARARPGPHRRGGGPPYPLGHHVPRPADAPAGRLRAALRRWLRPRHPHRRAAPGRAAPVRPARSRPPRAATTRPSTAPSPRRARSC